MVEDHECELCEAARYTHWYSEDEVCWVADCEVCSTPMVVWSRHGSHPSDDEVKHMLGRLGDAATARFGEGCFVIDSTMRQIPDHFHAHARDPEWLDRRWNEPMSRYKGVGSQRSTRTRE